MLLPSVVLALLLAGCQGNPNQQQAQDPAQAAGDPATANLAPASDATTGAPAQENPPAPPADQGSAAPADQGQPGYEQAGYGQSGYEQAPPPDDDQYGDEYAETAETMAPEPPPEIPDYEQPPPPDPDYIWTPGYWAYGPGGYYWVPGAWVLAPFVGALWTPGYWGWDNDRYYWHHGFWGEHIGFYGGVNYGYGYDGDGYEGGYWRDRHFYYNTAVTRVNVTIIHNTYNYRVERPFNRSRVAYNGGRGGLNYRPTPRQVAARQETHFAPLPVQHTLAQTAQRNRAQFAAQNHGRPQLAAENRSMNEGRRAPAPRPQDFHGAPQIHATARPATKFGPLNTGRPEPGRPAVNNRPGARTAPGARTEAQPGARQPGARTAPDNRNLPAAHGRPVNRPEPRNQPARPPEVRTQPQTSPAVARPHPGATARPRPEERPQAPAPQARPEGRPSGHPEARPETQTRPETRPAPQARPENRPSGQTRPEARPENRSPAQARPEARPPSRPEARPARPEARPAPAHPHPQEKQGEKQPQA